MSYNPGSSDWAAARGDRWRAQADGMEAMLQPVDAPLIDALGLAGDAPLRIAEVGSGAGGTTLALVRRAPAGSTVHGFDISAGLVELARARATAAAVPVTFALADMATAAPDQRYDRLVSRFGIMFFADPPAAFANLARWLAPGGRFAFAAWGKLVDNAWTALARDVIAEVVELAPSPPDAPGPFRYGDAAPLVAILARAGFADVAVRDWDGELPIGGGLAAPAAAAFAITALSSFAEALGAAGEGARALAEAQRRLTTAFAAHERAGAVHLAARVHVITGALP